MRRLLITGATGLVGSHVAERAVERGQPVRALVRRRSDTALLDEWGVELVEGDLTDAGSLERALEGIDWVVHCAAKVGEWGKLEDYRRINVRALGDLLRAVKASNVSRFVHISSLGVYPARHHYGTDECVACCTDGSDAYTRSKAEGEQVVLHHVAERGVPAVILRPGFVYGARDRTVLPRILERLRDGKMVLFGSGAQLMNNTYVGNLVDAVFLALERPEAVGQTYNITDGALVTKREFLSTIAELAGYHAPRKRIPLPVARVLASVMETAARLLRKPEAPLVTSARVKFLGLNLHFSIAKARRELGYEPHWSFHEAIEPTIAWFRQETPQQQGSPTATETIPLAANRASFLGPALAALEIIRDSELQTLSDFVF